MSNENQRPVELHHLSNGTIDVALSNYGCTIVSICVPDRNGVKKNIVAGFSDPIQYLSEHPYLGCTIGRFANRIANGKFRIDGRSYSLPINDGVNHLHGGDNGFHKQMWEVEKRNDGISFYYLSKHDEAGYPGNLNVRATFSLTENNKLVIQYTATTDKPTIINLTNHSYFNLTGFEDATVYNHLLTVYADSYTEKNANNVSSGKIMPVINTPYNFAEPKRIGKDIDLLTTDRGYDINYVLREKYSEIALAAELFEPTSGRLLKIFTNQPGMQVYTANWWDGLLTGSQGRPFEKHGAIAMETQDFPDSPNHKDFPSAVLRPGEVYRRETIFQFLNAVE
jgi:aldose 1-epimerase